MIEYNEYYILENNFVGERFKRFYAAHGSGTLYSAPSMTDSTANGTLWRDGLPDDIPENYYKNVLIQPDVTRAPRAEVSAAMWKVDKHGRFTVTIKNLSGATLSSATNDATVTVVIYEDMLDPALQNPRISATKRLVVAAGSKAITTPLANGATADFSIDTIDLGSTVPVHWVDWNKVHGVAFVDYRPAGNTGPYDMLQASMATYYPQAPSVSAVPNSVTKWAVEGQAPFSQSQSIQLTSAPTGLSWTATKTAPWLSLSATSGTFPATLTVTINSTGRVPGLYQDTVHITVPATSISPSMSQDISVTMVVDVTPPKLFYLPSVLR